MGAEESTTFAYCNKDSLTQNEVSKEIEHREQALTTKHHKENATKEKEQHQELEKELDTAYGEIQSLTNKKNSINMQYLRLEEDYHRESAEKTKLVDQIEKSTQRYDAMINSQKLLEEQYETEIQQYKASNTRLQQEIDGFKDTQKENETLRNIKKELEEEVEKLTRIIAEFKSNPDEDGTADKNVAQYKGEIAQYKSEIVQINAANASLQQQIDQLQNTLNGKKDLEEEVAKLTRVIEEYKATKTPADGANNENNEKSIEMIELEQENESLKNELQVLKMDLNQNQQTIAALSQQLLVAQNELTKAQVAAVTNTTAQVAAISNGQAPQNKPLKAVMSHETQLSDDAVWKTLDQTQLDDVGSFVRNRYGTIDKGKHFDVNADEESDESSLSEQEKLEIAKRKATNDEEAQKIQKEMDEMRETMAAKQLSTIDDADEEYDGFTEENPRPRAGPGNLFRYASKANWDNKALVSQKQAMKEHMIQLLQQQSETNENMETIQEDT